MFLRLKMKQTNLVFLLLRNTFIQSSGNHRSQKCFFPDINIYETKKKKMSDNETLWAVF